MPRKGRDLEKLIGILESSLQGTDVTVTSPDIIPGIISKVPREVDVTLRAPDGSLTAFECRNWTDTKQGVAWIEQLASKKKDLGVQRVFAVSSSDFSEGARNLALHFGVELRTLDDLTFADIANWAPMNIPLVIHRGEFKQVRIYLADRSDQEASELLAKLKTVGNEVLFQDRETGQDVSLQEIWRRILAKNPQLYRGIDPNGESREVTIRVDFASGRYSVLIDNEPIQVVEIHFVAELWIVRPDMPVSRASQYSDADGEVMADVIQWEGETTDLVRGLTFIGIPKKPHRGQGET